MEIRSALLAGLTAFTSLSLAACQRSVNMATAQSPTWNATTIPYAGVREENRQYPDYGIINASILSADAQSPAKTPTSGGRGARR